MDAAYVVQYESALRSKEREIVTVLMHREGIAVDAQPDPFDEAQNAVERAVLVQNLDRNSLLLRDVQNALARIADGTYGDCLNCGEEISHKRLRAAPWARLCLDCQENADREQKQTPDFGIAA